VVQVITNSIDYKLDIAQAVNAPRIHYQGLPNWVLTEPFALDPEVFLGCGRGDIGLFLLLVGVRLNRF
jgi:gamma-glutamyltranspeptidase/glutathione hydrolase